MRVTSIRGDRQRGTLLTYKTDPHSHLLSDRSRTACHLQGTPVVPHISLVTLAPRHLAPPVWHRSSAHRAKSQIASSPLPSTFIMRFSSATFSVCAAAALLGGASAASNYAGSAPESSIAVLLSRSGGAIAKLEMRSSSFASSGGGFPWGSDKGIVSNTESHSTSIGDSTITSSSTSNSSNDDDKSSACKDDGSVMKTGNAVISSCNGKDSMTVGGVTFSDTDNDDDDEKDKKGDHKNDASAQTQSTLLALVAVAFPIIAFA
ncbi:hypothetical protein IE81DRAFT_323740 [Ceraceosorus guamensis]|uniref:Uncharacterized protein n=1 Tax=Ceraceosorus guamensis TaxID=1522189 RepID=A0A316W120_9BASI|nr:hypothetical protein IE81DRAFT_323740 [Ceraceosorus guamensis]PWN42251.1 hypothetical protein IE81DRAFT_323740 [Ceraceosorus guamensis]